MTCPWSITLSTSKTNPSSVIILPVGVRSAAASCRTAALNFGMSDLSSTAERALRLYRKRGHQQSS
jgi:hypothetical protein